MSCMAAGRPKTRLVRSWWILSVLGWEGPKGSWPCNRFNAILRSDHSILGISFKSAGRQLPNYGILFRSLQELSETTAKPGLLGRFVRRLTMNREDLLRGLGSNHACLVCRTADKGELSYIHYSEGLSGEMN
jgi:hypothetical protein